MCKRLLLSPLSLSQLSPSIISFTPKESMMMAAIRFQTNEAYRLMIGVSKALSTLLMRMLKMKVFTYGLFHAVILSSMISEYPDEVNAPVNFLLDNFNRT
ncbi:hypothetical protein LXL04_011009 [Taraxacum kok-saghyz]